MQTKSTSSSSSSAAAGGAAASSAQGAASRLVLVEGDTASTSGANGVTTAAGKEEQQGEVEEEEETENGVHEDAGPSRRRSGAAMPGVKRSLRAGLTSASSSPAPVAREARSASLEEPLTIVKAEAPSTSLLGGSTSSHVVSSGAVAAAAAGGEAESSTTVSDKDPLRTEILPAPPSLPYDISYPPLHPTLVLPPPQAPNETRKPQPLPRSVTEMPMLSELPAAGDEGLPPADPRGGRVLPTAIRRNLEEKRQRKVNGEEQRNWLTKAGTKRRGPPPSSGPASKARKVGTPSTMRPGAETSTNSASHPQGSSSGSARGSSSQAAASSPAAGPSFSHDAASSPQVTIDEDATLLVSPAVTDDASLAGNAAAPATPSTGQPYLTPLESSMPHHASSPSSARSDVDVVMSEEVPTTAKSETTALALQGVSSAPNGSRQDPSSSMPSVTATPPPKRKPRARRSELENLAFEGLPDIEDRARSPSPSLDGEAADDGRRRPRAAHRKPRVAISWSMRAGSAGLPSVQGKEGSAEANAQDIAASGSANKKVKIEASPNPSGIAPNGKGKVEPPTSGRGRTSDVVASSSDPATATWTPNTRQTRSGTPSTSAQAAQGQQGTPTPWELASKTRTPVKELAISRLREKAEAASASTSPATGTKELEATAAAAAADAPSLLVSASAGTNVEEIIPNEEQCCVCLGTGQFLCCDGCPRSFHFNCMDPPLDVGEMPPTQPQPSGAATTPKKERNPDGTLLSEESWYCNVCRAERRAKAASSSTGTPKPPKRKPGTADAIFGPLLEHIDSTTQSTFALPPDVRNYFKGVATASDGSYVNVNLLRPIKVNKANAPDERDPYKLKDRHGKPVLCYRCGGSALPADEGSDGKGSKPVQRKAKASTGSSTTSSSSTPGAQDGGNGAAWRKIVSCDFCDQHWHLDCLEPPMIGMPGRMKKWMCPNHIDTLLPRQRVPKHPSSAPQVVTLPLPSDKTIGPGLHYRTRVVNDGHIDIIPDPLDTFFDAEGKGKGSGPGVELVEMPSPADSLAPKLRFAVPEKVVRLDFWQAVDASRKLSRWAGADAFPPPSTPLELLARIASSKLHTARVRPVQRLVRQALRTPATSSTPEEPIEYPYLADDEIPISSIRSSLLDEDLEEDERLAAAARGSDQGSSASRHAPAPPSHAKSEWAKSGAWSTASLGDSMDEDADPERSEQDGESLPTQDTSLTVMLPAAGKEGQQTKQSHDEGDRNLVSAAASLRSTKSQQQQQGAGDDVKKGGGDDGRETAGEEDGASQETMSAAEVRSLRAVKELLRLKGEKALLSFLLSDEGVEA